MSIIQNIDDQLKQYYKSKGQSYDKLFADHCNDNEFDDEDVINQFNKDDPDTCNLIEFMNWDKFPLEGEAIDCNGDQTQMRLAIYKELKNCYDKAIKSNIKSVYNGLYQSNQVNNKMHLQTKQIIDCEQYKINKRPKDDLSDEEPEADDNNNVCDISFFSDSESYNKAYNEQ